MAKIDLPQSGPWIGMSGMAVVLFLYVHAAVTVRDLVASLVLPLVWLALFALAIRWFVTHPLRVLVLPFVALGIWFAALLS